MSHVYMPWTRRVCTRIRHGYSLSFSRPLPVFLGLTLSSAVALCPVAAHADDQTDPESQNTLSVIEVEADKLAPESARLDQVAATTSVTREQFLLLPADRVSDIVSHMPGIIVSGPPGEKKSFSLRGLTSDFNRIEIDGVRLPTSGQTRSFELMNMPGDQVEKVEIKRTPTARDEADGIAGVISVETRSVPDTPTLEMTGAIGDGDATDGKDYRTSIFGGKAINSRFGGSFALNYDERTITKIKDRSERTYSGGPGGQGFLRDETEPKDFKNLDGFAVGEVTYDAGVIRLKPSFMIEETEVNKQRDQYRRVTGLFQDRVLTKSAEDTTTLGLTLENEHGFGNGVMLESRAVMARTDFESESRETTLNSTLAFDSAGLEKSDISDTLFQIGQDLGKPLQWGDTGHRPGIGYLAKYSDRSSNRDVYTVDVNGTVSQTADNLTASVNSDYTITETYLATYVMDEITMGQVTVAPGMRFEYVENDLKGSVSQGNPTQFDVLPSLPVTWRATEQLSFQAGIARTVNRPKFDEIAPGITRRGQRSFYGNPNLDPARAWGYDAGVMWTDQNLFLGVNLFHRDIKDVIESMETATNVYNFRNVGDGWARGIELEQRFGLGGILGIPALQPFSILANETFVNTEVDDPMTGKRPFADQAKFSGNLSLVWDDQDRGTKLALVSNYTGDRKTISYEGSGAVRDKTRYAEWTFDIRAEQEILDGWSIFVTGENLTDVERDEIEYLDGVLNRTAQIGTGRTFYVGSTVKF